MLHNKQQELFMLMSIASILFNYSNPVRCEKSKDQRARDVLWGGECGLVPNGKKPPMWPGAQFEPDKLVPSFVTIATDKLPSGQLVNYCSGILLNNRQVLTTNSCVQLHKRDSRKRNGKRNPFRLTIYGGKLVCDLNKSYKIFGIEANSVCTSSELLSGSNNKSGDATATAAHYDIAILQLQWFLPESPFVNRACLDKSGNTNTSSSQPLLLVQPSKESSMISIPGCYFEKTKIHRDSCPPELKINEKTYFCALPDHPTTGLSNALHSPIMMQDNFNSVIKHHLVGFVSGVTEITDDYPQMLIILDLRAINKEIMELSDECNYGNEE